MNTAESFSGHLLHTYMSTHTPTGPFGQPLNISTHGPMSFAPAMHGSSNASFPTQSSFLSEASLMEMSEDSAKRIATLQAKLDKKLGPEYISQRPGPGGGPKLTYAEGWKIINLANEVFGFNGWSSNVVSITTDFIDYSEETRRFNVGVTAIVRVTLRDGVFHEDVGYGLLENSKSKGAALDKCKKEAVTDAVKRTLRNFGNLLGNCLYDKAYTQEVIKIKVPPPKFDRDQLHRRPEFEETKPNVPASTSTSVSSSTSTMTAGPWIKSEPVTMPPPPNVPARTSHSVSPSEVRLNCGLAVRPTSTPNAQRHAPPPTATVAQPTGLQTPVHTPAGRPNQTNGGDRMAQNLASRHAARLKQIQEAQEAQRKEDAESAARAQSSAATHEAQVGSDAGERRVRFAPAAEANTPAADSGATAQSRVSPPQVVPQPSDMAPDDEYHFPSEDDAFLASLDFDALDEGIGRPIDFEEGARPDIDDSMDVSTSGTSTGVGGPSVGGRGQQQQSPEATNVLPTAAANVRSSHAAPHTRQGTSASAVQGGRARTPSMGGGFNFPSAAAGSSTNIAGQRQAHQQSAEARNINMNISGGMHTNSTVGQKRSADVMQGVSAAQQQRRPAQGMGLQHPPAGGAHPGQGVKREPFAALETADNGGVKRPRW
ncbi:hypothetical protein C8Q73DRAFT_313586 [Cubamyces lactineus]|nr:hypothetical protein C8Q73DRAFT_313586 [Cubamyces lactineus]